MLQVAIPKVIVIASVLLFLGFIPIHHIPSVQAVRHAYCPFGRNQDSEFHKDSMCRQKSVCLRECRTLYLNGNITEDIKERLQDLLQPDEGHDPLEHLDVVPLDEWSVRGPDCSRQRSIGSIRKKKPPPGSGRPKTGTGVRVEDEGDGLCVNRDVGTECHQWATEGECHKNPAWMVSNCPTACRMFGTVGGCQDKHKKCLYWAIKKECDTNGVWMFFNCPLACKKCGVVFNG